MYSREGMHVLFLCLQGIEQPRFPVFVLWIFHDHIRCYVQLRAGQPEKKASRSLSPKIGIKHRPLGQLGGFGEPFVL